VEEHYSPVTGLAQSVERGPFKPNVTGSSPVIGIELLVSLKLVLTADLNCQQSNPRGAVDNASAFYKAVLTDHLV